LRLALQGVNYLRCCTFTSFQSLDPKRLLYNITVLGPQNTVMSRASTSSWMIHARLQYIILWNKRMCHWTKPMETPRSLELYPISASHLVIERDYTVCITFDFSFPGFLRPMLGCKVLKLAIFGVSGHFSSLLCFSPVFDMDIDIAPKSTRVKACSECRQQKVSHIPLGQAVG
jgi:hypothetical protein